MSFYVDLDAPTGHQIVEAPAHHRDRHFLPAGGSYDECVVELVEAGGIFCPPRNSPETIEDFTARLAAEARARLAAE